MLEDFLSAVPDTLTVDDVAELTGYHRRTILRYVQRKYIYAVNIMGKYYISKQSIINYLATDKAFKNTQKTPWHISVIGQFLKKNPLKTLDFQGILAEAEGFEPPWGCPQTVFKKSTKEYRFSLVRCSSG